MSKDEEEKAGLILTPEQQRELATVPDFMDADAGAGTENLQEFITPPRIKIIQKQSSDELQDQFGKSAVILSPQGFLIAPPAADGKRGDPFYIVPLLFFPEWAALNPYALKGQLPYFRERSRNPMHPIAIKSRRAETRDEPCPENPKFFVKNAEFLNFIVVLMGDHEFSGLPCAISFAKGDHKAGEAFAALLQARCGKKKMGADGKMRGTAIYGCQFRAQVQWRPGSGSGDYYGIDISNPTAEDNAKGIGPLSTRDPVIYAKLKGMSESFTAKMLDIMIDHEDDVLDVPSDTVNDDDM